MATGVSRRTVVRVLAAVVVIDVAFWVAWYADRSLVASNARPAHYEFENAFPLADGWLALCCLGAIVGLRRHSPTALLWLLMAAGGGYYLFGMDALYDLEHGIWWSSGGGLVELGINILTAGVASVLLRWTWLNRAELLRSP